MIEEGCLELGQSANRTVLTTGYGLSFQHRCTYFSLVSLPVSVLSSCSFQQRSSHSAVEVSAVPNKLLEISFSCLLGTFLPRGDQGKGACSWNANSQPVILAEIPAHSSLHFRLALQTCLVHLCSPRVKVWASLKGERMSQSVLLSQWLSDCAGGRVANQMKSSLNQKVFKIHGSHEQVAGFEPLCL